jgi:hypothetical protein
MAGRCFKGGTGMCDVLLDNELIENSDYNNPDIHNSHIKFSDDILLTKNNLTKILNNLNITLADYINIKKQIKLILKTSFNIVYPYIKPYENAQNAFEIFGCDFMIDNNKNVYILEINDHTNHKFRTFNNLDVINFQKALAKWVYEKTLKNINL